MRVKNSVQSLQKIIVTLVNKSVRGPVIRVHFLRKFALIFYALNSRRFIMSNDSITRNWFEIFEIICSIERIMIDNSDWPIRKFRFFLGILILSHIICYDWYDLTSKLAFRRDIPKVKNPEKSALGILKDFQISIPIPENSGFSFFYLIPRGRI